MVRAATAARTSYGRLLALLASGTGDLAAAEDALADAFEAALRTWPERGVPANPDGWLLTVGRNRLRDHWKSAAVQRSSEFDPQRHGGAYADDIDPDAIPDKRLELMLVCAHPAIDAAAHTALMLNTVLGFTAAQIADIFVVPPATMSTRLLRAKRKIKETKIPFTVPDRDDLRPRLDAVVEAVYGAYVIEWSTTGTEPRMLPPEALVLAEVLAELVPEDPEVRGLAALVELSAARARARYDDQGRFVPLADQDPARWEWKLIERARAHLRAAHGKRTLGRYQVEAAIQALHCARAETGTTDWASLRELHEILAALAPSLGSAVALAVAYAETDGPVAGVAALDEIAGQTQRFQPAWAARAELLARLGDTEAAAAAYEKAIGLTEPGAEREYLRQRWSESS